MSLSIIHSLQRSESHFLKVNQIEPLSYLKLLPDLLESSLNYSSWSASPCINRALFPSEVLYPVTSPLVTYQAHSQLRALALAIPSVALWFTPSCPSSLSSGITSSKNLSDYPAQNRAKSISIVSPNAIYFISVSSIRNYLFIYLFTSSLPVSSSPSTLW